jgi:hypothetical protein
MGTVKYAWLRWIAVLPASIAAYVLLPVVMGLISEIQKFFASRFSMWIFDYVLPIVSNGYAGYVFIAAGYYVAPYHKKVTALILLCIFLLFNGALIFTLINNPEYRVIDYIKFGISIIGAIGGYIAMEDDKNY